MPKFTIFSYFWFIVTEYLTKPEPALPADEDQEALKQLTAMGFQENLAKKALHLNQFVLFT